jgi:acetolactate synthase-1/2/3 large subunit
MKVSDYIADFLEAQGVAQVYELVGGMITHLLDSVASKGKISIVSVHHEQGASFAADAAGRMSGVPGVAMATSGPGATNLLTGIGSCYFDSSPAVFITGQVNRNEQKGERPIRQLGFQETDIVSMAAPITKWSYLVSRPEEVPEVLKRAFSLALSGRPGPVLIDIPLDVQRAEISAEAPQKCALPPELPPDPAYVADCVRELLAAQRPLILAGGGVRAAGAAELFLDFVGAVQVPVVHSLLAVELLPFGHPSRVGMIGSYGNRWANLAIERSDFMLVVGSRLDIRQTGSETEAFKGKRKIYHIDVDAGELGNRIEGCRTLVSDLKPFFRAAIAQAAGQAQPRPQVQAWFAEIAASRDQWPDTAETGDVGGINPNALMHALSAHPGASLAAAYCVDVGQHQMWAAQSLELRPGQRFLTSGGMGAMGFALPASLGAAFSGRGKPVVVIAGDGGFQLNIQELQTIRRNHLPVKMLVVNNLCHGMVRQFQQSYFEGRYQSTFWGYSAPDFSEVAKAYKIASFRVGDFSGLAKGLDAFYADPAEPFLLEVMVDTFANAYPKLAFGRPISQMEPFAKPTEMEGT